MTQDPRSWRELAMRLGISPERFEAESISEQVLRELERLRQLPTYTIYESEGERIIVQFDDQEGSIDLYHQFDDAPDMNQVIVLRGDAMNELMAAVLEHAGGRA